MAKMTDKNLKCEDCFFLCERATDPTNITKRSFECRSVPPQMIGVPVQQNGGLGIQAIVMYPEVSPAYPACGLHVTPEEIGEAPANLDS